jgi:hypothetical protein
VPGGPVPSGTPRFGQAKTTINQETEEKLARQGSNGALHEVLILCRLSGLAFFYYSFCEKNPELTWSY